MFGRFIKQMHKAVRTKYVLMERINQMESQFDVNWDERIPNDLNDPFYSSFINQMEYLQSFHDLKVIDLCTILRISTKTYEKIIRHEIENPVGRPPLIDEEVEQVFIQKITRRQMKGDCMSPKEARKWLEKYIFKKTHKEVSIDREWWFRFKQKHSKLINVFKIHSIESKRCTIDKKDLNLYFTSLTVELKKNCFPDLIINMDESGFIRRPEMNSVKNCICLNNCPVHPTFREENDGNHISVVAAVTLSGKTLKPMLISTTENPPLEVTNSLLGNKFIWAKSKKGYLNEKIMIFWITQILIPYINSVKAIYGQDLVPLLIFDGLKAHKTDNVIQLLNDNGIRHLNYPPNCTHLVQCLDLCFFGIMKKEYKNIQASLFPKGHKTARKIEKILKGIYIAGFPTSIIAGWIEAGFDLAYENGEISHVYINRNKVLTKITYS